MSELTPSQDYYLSTFDQGVRYAIHRVQQKLWYIPEDWKKDRTLVIYNIVMTTLQELEDQLSHKED